MYIGRTHLDAVRGKTRSGASRIPYIDKRGYEMKVTIFISSERRRYMGYYPLYGDASIARFDKEMRQVRTSYSTYLRAIR